MARAGCTAYREIMRSSFHVSEVSRGQADAMLGGAASMMTLAMCMHQNLGLFQGPAAKAAAPIGSARGTRPSMARPLPWRSGKPASTKTIS